MKTCPACNEPTVKVIRSREVKDGRRRVHVCRACGHRWRSLEVPAEAEVERYARAREALEALIGALQTAIGEIKALSNGRA